MQPLKMLVSVKLTCNYIVSLHLFYYSKLESNYLYTLEAFLPNAIPYSISLSDINNMKKKYIFSKV